MKNQQLVLLLALFVCICNGQSCALYSQDKPPRCGCYQEACWRYINTTVYKGGDPWCFTQVLRETKPRRNWKLCTAASDCDLQMTCGSQSTYKQYVQRSAEDTLPLLRKLEDLPATQISAERTDELILGVTSANKLLQYLSSGWRELDTPPVMAVSSGFDNSIWIITPDGNLFRASNGDSQSFDGVQFSAVESFGLVFKDISSKTFTEAFGVLSNQSMFHFRDEKWIQAPGSATTVSLGMDGGLWHVNQAQDLWRWSPGSSKWESVTGKATSIDVYQGNNRVAIVDPDNNVLTWNGQAYMQKKGLKCLQVRITKQKLYCLDMEKRIRKTE